jgi:hypothetical protein
MIKTDSRSDEFMGLDNSLELATEMKAADALRLLAMRLPLRWGDAVHLVGRGVFISAVDGGDVPDVMIEDAFHFRPTLSVGFRIDTGDDEDPGAYEEAHRLMLRATMLLLEHSGDGVLLFNGEHVRLQRLGGELVLNENYTNWTDGLCLEIEIRLPHGKRPLRSPLL